MLYFYSFLVFAFQDKQVVSPHSFCVNMRLEAVDPWSPFGISPATVVKVKWGDSAGKNSCWATGLGTW